jgi:hypothetical protein
MTKKNHSNLISPNLISPPLRGFFKKKQENQLQRIPLIKGFEEVV